jgi:single-stranded-DNA-specific exonuclease
MRSTPAVLSPFLTDLLFRRGLTLPEDIERFLFPSYERDIGDPFGITDMEKAVLRVLDAVASGERITIYGDYDADGIPGSVVLHDFFRKIGHDALSVYIPHRHHEGYGLNQGAIETLAKEGTSLLITVDSGITDTAEVALANSLGMEVIVTDHHLVPPELPPAYAVLNSKRADDSYHDDMLCGAAVAWKLVSALLVRGKKDPREEVRSRFEAVPDGWEKTLLDMAGLSTIADMVPLRKENRAIATFGLRMLRLSRRPGLRALLDEAKVSQESLVEDDIAFTIAPRLNAASRMDVPLRAFELLATRDSAEARMLAEHLGSLNGERKSEVARMMKEARRVLALREVREVIVLGNPAWRVGVVGIVAGQIAEEFDRPTFVWGKEGSSVIKGSCRSDGRVDLVALMRALPDGVVADFGGHEFSGGFSLAHDAIHHLEDELVRAHGRIAVREKSEDAEGEPECALSLGDVDAAHWEDLSLLAPFGEGNPKPIFRFSAVRIEKVERFGKEKQHLRLSLKDGSGRAQAIAFFSGPDDYDAEVVEGAVVDLIATMERSTFLGRTELRLRIVDVNQSGVDF